MLAEDELKDATRLACQVKVKEDLTIRVPAELLSVRQFPARVEAIETLTHAFRGVLSEQGETAERAAGQDTSDWSVEHIY